MIIFQILSRGVSMCRNGSKILPQKSAFYSGEWGGQLAPVYPTVSANSVFYIKVVKSGSAPYKLETLLE